MSLDFGPRIVTISYETCEGCPKLKTEYWKEYYDNDDYDSGTKGYCTAIEPEKLIEHYWSQTVKTPAWCPAKQETWIETNVGC